MVAHTATTRVHDPTDPLPGGHAPPIPAHLHDRILSELCHPGSSLTSVARDNRVTVCQLALWLSEPETRAKMLAIEKGGYAHTRMAASVCLASTVNVLHTIIEDYTQVRAHAKALVAERTRIDTSPHTPHNRRCGVEFKSHPSRSLLPGEAILGSDSYLERRLEARRTESVRRAAHHLYRLSRIVPVDDTKLALALAHSARVPLVPGERSEAEPVLRESRAPDRLSTDANNNELPTLSESSIPVRVVNARTANVSERTSSLGGTALQSGSSSSVSTADSGTANVSERTLSSSDSQLPSQPVHPAGALHDLPIASSLNDDANSQRIREIISGLTLDKLDAIAKGLNPAPVPVEFPDDHNETEPGHPTPAAPSPPTPIPRPTHAA